MSRIRDSLRQRVWLALFIPLALAAVAQTPAFAEGSPGDADQVGKLLPAVVTIAVRKPPDSWDATSAASGAARTDDSDGDAWITYYGSGFVVNAAGIILTNRHVVEGTRDIVVSFNDGRRVRGQVLATGGDADLALVKIAADQPLPILKFGDSDKVRIGDRVLVIGNPLGIGISVSSGIVSALNRDINDGPYDDFIQTDAALNHGNSGGPLINASGEVIGVSTALYSNVANGGSIGLGFAMTSNGAKFVVDRLIKYGRIKAGWLGFSLQDIGPAFVDAMSLPSSSGSIIDTIDPDMPAAKAGLQPGDVILSMDGDTPDDSRALMRAIAHREVGSTVHLSVFRDGRQFEVAPVLVEWPGDMRPDQLPPLAEVARPMRLSPVTAALRQQYNLDAAQAGVVVTEVAPLLVTGERNLVPGDVILRVQDRAVVTPADVWAALGEAKQQKRQHVIMLVQGRSSRTWLPLPVGSMK